MVAPGTHQGSSADDGTWKMPALGKLTKKQPQKEHWVSEEAERSVPGAMAVWTQTGQAREEE